MLRLRLLAVFLLGIWAVGFGGGCSSGGDKRMFSLVVENKSSKPVTLGLTKNGPPMEAYWETPTERALMDPRNTGLGWGKVVPPGKTVVVEKLPGLFLPSTSAFLRVYVGDLSLNEILAIGTDSRNRFDIRLREGTSTFVIQDRGPFLDITMTDYRAEGEEARRSPSIREQP